MTPPLSSVTDFARGSVTLASTSLSTSVRVAGKTEELLDEVILMMRAARPLVAALSSAVDEGLIDDVKAIIASVPETQEDVRAAREAVDRLVALVNVSLDQVGGVPGAKLVLKGLTRVTGVPGLG